MKIIDKRNKITLHFVPPARKSFDLDLDTACQNMMNLAWLKLLTAMFGLIKRRFLTFVMLKTVEMRSCIGIPLLPWPVSVQFISSTESTYNGGRPYLARQIIIANT